MIATHPVRPREERRTVPLRVAVLGAGAVVELCHIPALRRTEGIVISAIADRNRERACHVASSLPNCAAVSDIAEAIDKADAVINALPHDLHAPVSIACLERGIHVLVEKPMARNTAEARAMIDAAHRMNALLQVGLMYRYCDGPRLLKQSTESGRLGAIQRVTLEWGGVYDWPVQSGFFFDRERAGGGVLIDTGSHALDLLTWLLGPLLVTDYADDSHGGVEADCEIRLCAQALTGRPEVAVRLSRLRNLSNRLTIHAEHWEVCYDVGTPDAIVWRVTSPECAPGGLELHGRGTVRQTWGDVYAAQVTNFVDAVTNRATVVPTGRDALRSVELIDACYVGRRTLAFPWDAPMETER